MELHPPLHIGVVAIEKGALGSSSTTVANFTYDILLCLDFFFFFGLSISETQSAASPAEG